LSGAYAFAKDLADNYYPLPSKLLPCPLGIAHCLLMKQSEQYMHRCIQLARLGEGHVAPNPLVGAVLVHESRIIGEGFHERYGQAHAEVNCLASVKKEDEHLIPFSTLYVSLEPCAHFGKTPPCADLIVSKKIPKVVIGSSDPYVEVRGKGIEKLKRAGIGVELGLLENECIDLNKRFFRFHKEHRSYVVLKWAQSSNGKMARTDRARFPISNEISRRLVHKWRSEESSILVGTNTAFFDDPDLGNRFWHGTSPLRLVVDMELRLPSSLKIFNGEIPTIVFNRHKHSLEQIDFRSSHPLGKEGLAYYQVSFDAGLVQQIMHALYQLNIQSVLVEGGARLLQSFIDEGYWDEIRLITNTELQLEEGIASPVFNGHKINEEELISDRIEIFKPPAAI
jgi:diaminohydroxyphosphoribosylaminopyrimidine deaminase / 5-amino-6-(5-phosphoribosylamino)uracil reductase